MNNDLNKYLSPLNVFALALGGILGWGSFVMPGTTFLPLAGPLGTAIGMILGTILILTVAANYHYLINRYPKCGGAFSFVKNIFGYDHGFLCAWFLIITYVALIWSNSTAIALIGRKIFNGAFQFGFHYQLFGYEIYLTEVAISICAILIFAYICTIKNIAAKILSIMAVSMLAIVIFIFTQSILSVDLKIFEPLFVPNVEPLNQILSIVTFAPFAFVGFESISNSAQEFNFSPKKSFKLMTLAILAGLLFYILLTELAVTSTAKDYYDWKFMIDNLSYTQGINSIPTFAAAYKFLDSTGLYILTIALFFTLTTSLITFFTASSRLLYSMSKENFVSKKFAELSNGVPKNAIMFIAAISILIPFLGRTAIEWCIDLTSIGADIAYAYISAAAYKLAREEKLISIKISAIIGIIFSLVFGLFLLIPTLLSVTKLSTETYFILVVWSILGFIYFGRLLNRDEKNIFGKSVVIWIVMIFIIFFESTMWTRQVNSKSIESMMYSINKFYFNEWKEYHVKRDRVKQEREDVFLKLQLESIKENLLNQSLIQTIVLVISLGVMFNIFLIMRRRENKAEIDKLTAQESNRAKTLFLANMSHDIRTPMNAIIGYTTLARREGVTLEEMKNFLIKIESSSKHLLALINDVLEMSRIEAGKIELELVETDLIKILDEVYDMFLNQMQMKNINFTVDTSEIKNRNVFCDRNRLNRVLLNLISNSYKFTPKNGSVEVKLSEVNVDKNFSDYELRVKDSGIGMSEEFAEKVFESFTRERTSTVSGIEGTGLGMAITKSIVDLMNGTIELKTAQNKGTEFIIHLKFKLCEEVKEVVEEKISDEKILKSAQKKILLVEDIEVNREIATMILMQAGFLVDTAENGKEAVEKISQSKVGDYDLILMDIQMPVMNGYEATKLIRQLENKSLAQIPILAMTANAFAEDIKNAKESGMNDHIAKPINVTKLMTTLAKYLN